MTKRSESKLPFEHSFRDNATITHTTNPIIGNRITLPCRQGDTKLRTAPLQRKIELPRVFRPVSTTTLQLVAISIYGTMSNACSGDLITGSRISVLPSGACDELFDNQRHSKIELPDVFSPVTLRLHTLSSRRTGRHFDECNNYLIIER